MLLFEECFSGILILTGIIAQFYTYGRCVCTIQYYCLCTHFEIKEHNPYAKWELFVVFLVLADMDCEQALMQ